MDYYLLTEDERVKQPLKFNSQLFGNEKDDIVIQCDITKNTLYVDYVQARQHIDVCSLISEKVKNIILSYDREICFFGVFITSMNLETQLIYWRFDMNTIKTINKDRLDKEIIISLADIGAEEVLFRVASKTQEFIVLREDLAESIMRRKPLGIKFKKLDTPEVSK